MCRASTCLIIDDIVDTAGTLVKTVDALLEKGATKVYACASHPVLSGPAVERIANSRLEELVVTDSIPLNEAAQKLSKIKVRSMAGLLAADHREHPHGDERQLAVQLERVRQLDSTRN